MVNSPPISPASQIFESDENHLYSFRASFFEKGFLGMPKIEPGRFLIHLSQQRLIIEPVQISDTELYASFAAALIVGPLANHGQRRLSRKKMKEMAGTFVSIPYSIIQAFEPGGPLKKNVVMILKENSKIQEIKYFNVAPSSDNLNILGMNNDFIDIGNRLLKEYQL